MSTNKTGNYNLHSWVPGDDFLREEFNENFAAIDAALGVLAGDAPKCKKLRIVTGSYTGNERSPRTIALPFTPKAVYLACKGYGDSYSLNALYLPGVPTGYGEIVADGFTVSGAMNVARDGSVGILGGELLNPYRYIALYWEE